MRSSKQTYARGHRAKGKQQDNSKEFEKYYSGIYGDRWPSLREALIRPTVHSAVANGFIPSASAAACTTAGLTPLLSVGPLHAYRRTQSSGPYPSPPLDPASALRAWYWMDLASVLPVLLLQPRRGDVVLDMCAAPGGKSSLAAQWLFGPNQQQQQQQQGPAVAAVGAVVGAGAAASSAGAGAEAGPAREALAAGAAVASEEGAAERIPATAEAASTSASAAAPCCSSSSGQEEAAATPPPASPLPLPLPLPLAPGKLVCNEADRVRLQRLHRVLEEYLPVAARAHVEVLNYRGQLYWARNQAARYDAVLVDAPCSSDRHVLQQAVAGAGGGGAGGKGQMAAADWSLEGCKRIADEQLQLCLAALRCLRPGGRLVYSTCSISPLQND
ncbi:hypothetical protein Agub_g4979, partial [Astrephomene gubernaculifera]